MTGGMYGLGSGSGVVGRQNDPDLQGLGKASGPANLYTHDQAELARVLNSSIGRSDRTSDIRYANIPSNPSLPSPRSFEAQSLPQPTTTSGGNLETPESAFPGSAEAAIKNILSQNNITATPEQLNTLLFAYYQNIPLSNFTNLPSGIPSDLYSQADEQVVANQTAKFTSAGLNNWTINSSKQKESDDFLAAFNQAFENLIQQKYPGDNQFQAQLRAAFYLEGQDPTNGKLNELKEQALATLRNEYPNPVGWAPKPDSTKLEAKMITSFDNQFEAELAKLTNLSKKEEGILKTLHYYVPNFLDAWAKGQGKTAQEVLADPQLSQNFWNYLNTEIPGALSVKDTYTQLTNSIQGKLATEFALPVGYNVPPGLGSFEAEVNGAWRSEFDKILQGYTPEQIASVNAAIADRTKMTKQTQAIIDEISQQAAQNIISKYNAPISWQPSLTLAPINPGIQFAQNGVNELQDLYDSLFTHINTMQESPAKQLLLNILKVISQAISDLQQLIYKMQGLDAQKAKDLGKAQLESTLNKIAEELAKMKDIWRQQDEASEAEKKAKKWGLVAKIFTPILMVAAVVLTVLSGGTFGPVAIVVISICATAMVADSIYSAVTGDSFIRGFFHVILQAAKAAGVVAEGFALAFEYMLIIAVAVFSANPMLGAMLFSQSGVMHDTLITAGCSEKQAALGALIADIAVMVVCMVGTSAMARGASKAAAQGAEVGAENAASKTAGWFARNVWKASSDPARNARIMKFFSEEFVPWTVRLTGAATAGAQAANQFYTAQGLLLRANAAETKGDLDKFLAEMEALIKILKQTQQKLLQALAGYGEWAAQSQMMLGDMYNQLRAVSTNIKGALNG